MAPPVSALNPSQKLGCSPEPPCRQEPVEPNSPVSLPTNDHSGFSAEQLATIKALIQSCLAPPTLFSLYSASAPSLPAPILPTTTATDTPRAGPSWVSGPPPPTPPLPGPSGIRPARSLSPRPGPSWASDPPLVEEPGELTGTAELVVLSDSEEGDAVTPPVVRSCLDPLHLAAAEVLDRLWHDTLANISPIPIPGIQGHTESTIYYCGSRIHYQWHEEIPKLILFEGNSHIHLPVDQDFVRVLGEGSHLAFSTAELDESLHAIFRPFVLAALLTRPQTSRSHPSRHQLRSVAALDLVRQRASFTPMDPSKDKWVESYKALATKLLAAVEDAQKNTEKYEPRGRGFLNIFRDLFSLLPLRILLIRISMRSFRPASPAICSSTSRVNDPLHIIIGHCCTPFNWHATSLQ